MLKVTNAAEGPNYAGNCQLLLTPSPSTVSLSADGHLTPVVLQPMNASGKKLEQKKIVTLNYFEALRQLF